jgi:uncharacterized membrane protein (UPF0127 family)
MSAPRIVLLGPVLAVLVAACSNRPDAASTLVRIRTSTGGVAVHALIADTNAERRRGLAGRRRLARDAGMAFLFSRPVRVAFWMKDTRIPLSIAFWGRRGRIVAIMDMSPCRSRGCPSYRPAVPYQGALEANRGFFQAHGVDVGDRVEIARG